jgi:hypothetical protein
MMSEYISELVEDQNFNSEYYPYLIEAANQYDRKQEISEISDINYEIEFSDELPF